MIGIHEFLVYYNDRDVLRVFVFTPEYIYWIGAFFLWIFGFAFSAMDLRTRERPEDFSDNAFYYVTKIALILVSSMGVFSTLLYISEIHIVLFPDSQSVQWAIENKYKLPRVTKYLDSVNFINRNQYWFWSVVISSVFALIAFIPRLKSEPPTIKEIKQDPKKTSNVCQNINTRDMEKSNLWIHILVWSIAICLVLIYWAG